MMDQHHYQSSPNSHRPASISAAALNIPIHHNHNTTLTSSLPPTPTSATYPNHFFTTPHHHRPTTEYSPFDLRSSSAAVQHANPDPVRRQSFPAHPSHVQADNNEYYTAPLPTSQPQPQQTQPQPQSQQPHAQSQQQQQHHHHQPPQQQTQLPSPPDLTTDESVSPPSNLMSPSTSALPSPYAAGSSAPLESFPSPLQGRSEHAGVVIPPMAVPPRDDTQYDDWDDLPEILRQEPRADLSPRRPMNAFFVYMRLRRPQFANANPTFSTGQLSKILGCEWKAMTTQQQAPWKFLHERLIRAFKRKYPDYQYERGGKRKKRGERSPEYPQQTSLYVHRPQYMSSTPRYMPYQLQRPQGGPYYVHNQQPVYYDQPVPTNMWQAQPPHPHADFENRPYSHYPGPDGPQNFAFGGNMFAATEPPPQYAPQWIQPGMPGQEPLPAPTPGYPTASESATEPVWEQYLNHQ